MYIVKKYEIEDQCLSDVIQDKTGVYLNEIHSGRELNGYCVRPTPTTETIRDKNFIKLAKTDFFIFSNMSPAHRHWKEVPFIYLDNETSWVHKKTFPKGMIKESSVILDLSSSEIIDEQLIEIYKISNKELAYRKDFVNKNFNKWLDNL